MVWRDTLVAFSAHSASILAGALCGFAMPSILAAILGALMTLEMFARTSTILVSYGPHRIVPLIFQGVVGLLVGSLARGVISWRVLRPDGKDFGMRGILRAALPHWLPLLLIMVITGALLFVGNLGLNALLVELRIDLADVGQLSATADGMARAIILRALGNLIPDSGAPFSELLSYIRIETSRNRDTGGAGLGLPVVRTVARAHGGDAQLMNRPEGGLRARVVLPLGAARQNSRD